MSSLATVAGAIDAASALGLPRPRGVGYSAYSFARPCLIVQRATGTFYNTVALTSRFRQRGQINFPTAAHPSVESWEQGRVLAAALRPTYTYTYTKTKALKRKRPSQTRVATAKLLAMKDMPAAYCMAVLAPMAASSAPGRQEGNTQ